MSGGALGLLGTLSGLAVKATKSMIELYRRRYGTWGEVVVKKLEEKLTAMAFEIDALHAENEKLTKNLKEAALREAILKADLESCTKNFENFKNVRGDIRPLDPLPDEH